MNILIAYGNRAVREFLEKLFMYRGHHTISAVDTEEALRLAHETPADMAMIDYDLPPEGGLPLVRALCDSVPCILSGHPTGSTEEAYAAGVVDVLDPAERPTSIVRLVERHHQLRRGGLAASGRPGSGEAGVRDGLADGEAEC